MSDLVATNCGGGCGCNGGNSGCSNIIWILLILACCGGNGGGLGLNNLFGGDNDCCSLIWILLLLSCCGGNGGGCGCGC
jgi:hypothetical protein